jgi:hypothetical protein
VSCNTCANWRPPLPEKRRSGGRHQLGRCALNDQLSHPGYHCGRFLASQVTPALVGMTEAEADWVRSHPHSEYGCRIIAAYRRVRNTPDNIGVREIFAAILAEWRQQKHYLRG